MFSGDTSDITFSSGSRLLSESPLVPSFRSSSHSHTGPGGEDLSLSELSLADRPTPRPSTSAPFYHNQSVDNHPFNDDSVDGGGFGDEVEKPENDEQTKRQAAKAREEKLQRDLFILKKLNTSFAAFNEVLKDTQTGTERVAEQLANTNALLDKYVKILGKSETVTRLIFDERWEGAEQDEQTIKDERKEAARKARQEAEELALNAQRERERAEKEERDAKARREKERIDDDRNQRIGTRGGVRGVRGTRASMRGTKVATGTRGAAPASSSTATKTGRPSGIPSARPSSAASRASGTTSTRSISRR